MLIALDNKFNPGYAATAPGGFRLHGSCKSGRVAENTLQSAITGKTTKPGEKSNRSEQTTVQA